MPLPFTSTTPLPPLLCAEHLLFTTLSSPTHRLSATNTAMGLRLIRVLTSAINNNPIHTPQPPGGIDDDDPALDSLRAAEELASIVLGMEPALVGAGSAETYVGWVVVEYLKAREGGDAEPGPGEGGEVGDARVQRGRGRDWNGPEREEREVVRRDEEGEGELQATGGYVAEWVRDAVGWQMVGFCGMDEMRSGRQGGGVGGVRMYQTTTSAVLVGCCWEHGWKVSVGVGELCVPRYPADEGEVYLDLSLDLQVLRDRYKSPLYTRTSNSVDFHEMTERGNRDPYTFKNQDWLPSVPVDVLTKILKGWDDSSDETNGYLNYFTPDAVLVFGQENQGREGIRAARDSMIHLQKGPITKCSHFFETAFVTGGGMGIDGKWEIIGVADVKYDMLGGGEVWTRAASWCRVVKGGDGQWQAERYEVFMDGSKLMEAISKVGK